MKFRLTYEGALKAAGNHSSRAVEKWDIRKKLHPQLVELWQTHPTLTSLTQRVASGSATEDFKKAMLPLDRGSYRFLPLVRQSLKMGCALDILFLRKEQPGQLIYQGGDVDNRIKTLFDGLRVPSDDEMVSGHPEGNDQFHCLLEQDALITDVTIRTDRLLTKPDASIHEVHLVIEVTVKIYGVTSANLDFLAE